MGYNVNHPDHYQNIAGVEAIDILNDVVKDLPGKQAAMLWNTLKYLLRFQKKNGVEDLRKAQNYLQYLIDDIDSSKNIQENQVEMLWDTWHSDEYGYMRIFAKSKERNGMPSKLVFDTEYVAEEFRNVFYRIISDGYGEFSLTDVALEMKFKISKYNKWNYWNDLVKWKEVHDSFSIEEVNGKYELIFNYKDSSSETPQNTNPKEGSCVIYKSKISGYAEVVCYYTEMLCGTCEKIRFTNEFARDMFVAEFFNKLNSEDYKEETYSIRDVLINSNYIVPNATDDFCIKLPWNDIFERFKMYKEDDKYVLEFVYKTWDET